MHSYQSQSSSDPVSTRIAEIVASYGTTDDASPQLLSRAEVNGFVGSIPRYDIYIRFGAYRC